jgi:glycosyltransferase involved in cell wall biosynthesis
MLFERMLDQQTDILSHNRFSALRCCVIMPTYNNGGTLADVIRKVLVYTNKLIVVNDGSTDHTALILAEFPGVQVISKSANKGKGMALRSGFQVAREQGYHYALTIDSDGQHFPSDFHLFLDKIEQEPGSLIIGARNMNSENVPGKSSFGNKFSNFWFLVETGITMPDTQSGFRLYPIQAMKNLRFFTARFEFEIEVIVKAAWSGIPITSVPVGVFYEKGPERVTHFRPRIDFARISILNTWFVILAILWYKPRRLIMNFNAANIRKFMLKHFADPSESSVRKSVSVAVGVFFGIVPIWGFQLAAAILASVVLRLNKAIVVVAANISLPPMIPIILYLSVKTGELVTGRVVVLRFSGLNLDLVKANACNFYVYMIGASVLSVIAALIAGILTYFLLGINGRKGTADIHS